MPRPSKKGVLGKSMIRQRFHGRDPRATQTIIAHSTDMNDGYDWAKMGSVTAQGDLENFLTTAEMAGTEFTAEKQNVSVIDMTAAGMQASIDKAQSALRVRLQAQDENKHRLRIPRRPKWDKTTTATELEDRERVSFLEWRRTLAVLEDEQDVIITPYERNIEFWRQLWRVVERSDVVVQIVDARNPLLFWCPDIEAYVKEIGPDKKCMVLLNKSDLLGEETRLRWGAYLDEIGVEFAFFSALLVAEEQMSENDLNADNDAADDLFDAVDSQLLERGTQMIDNNKYNPLASTSTSTSTSSSLNIEEEDDKDTDNSNGNIRNESNRESEDDNIANATPSTTTATTTTATLTTLPSTDSASAESTDNVTPTTTPPTTITNDDTTTDETSLLENLSLNTDKTQGSLQSRCQLYSAKRLLDFFHHIAGATASSTSSTGEKVPTIGMVGYPNVGKSSTINALCAEKKTSVSSTPGRTRHFQTILLDDLVLCDCPGLVFPTFASTKGEMVCNGILPIDQLQDYIRPVQHICDTVERVVLNSTYGIHVIEPAPDEPNPDRPPTALELLDSYGRARGIMSGRGEADGPRCSRYLLKDYVKGKLLYCHEPPQDGHTLPMQSQAIEQGANYNSKMIVGPKHDRKYVSSVDESFFSQQGIRALVRDRSVTNVQVTPSGKLSKHHNKRGRKEKQRRMEKGQARGITGFVTL